MLRKIISQSMLYYLAMYMPLIANIFILPLINKYLSAEDYAIYGLTFGYIGIFAGFSDLGLTNLLQNSYYKQRESYREIWSQFLGFLQLYRLLFAVIIGISLYFIFENRISDDLFIWFILLNIIPVAFFDFIKNVGVRHCQFQANHKLVYISTLISGVITITTTFITIYHFKMGFFGWFISMFLAKLFEFLYYSIYIYYFIKIRPNFRFNRKYIFARIKIALPLIPKSYSSYLINNADRAMLDIYRGAFGSVSMAQIGLYNIGYGFANYFGSFQQSVNTVISPIYFNLLSQGEKGQAEASSLIKNITRLWFSASLFAAFGLCLWLKEIMMYLYPKPEFQDAYSYSILIIMALCYRPFYTANIDRAIFNEKTIIMLKISFFAGALNILLNLIAIPLAGIHGAIAASFIAYLYMGFSGFYIKSLKKYITEEYYPIQNLLLLLFISALAFLSKDLNLPYKLFITALLAIIAVIWYLNSGKLQIKELNNLRLIKSETK